MELLLSLCIGLGLSAACGFRIFIPFLVVSLAIRGGHATVSPEFYWLATEPALIAFGTAATLEIAAYYVPWLDNLLDTIMTPAAVVAGSVLAATQITELSPFLKWALAVIAGGGTAGIIQGGTVLVRAASTAGSGGLGNSIVSTGELVSSLFVAVSAVLLPLIITILIGFVCYCVIKVTNRIFTKRSTLL